MTAPRKSPLASDGFHAVGIIYVGHARRPLDGTLIGPRFEAVCSCGWVHPDHLTRDEASQRAMEHHRETRG